MKYTLKSGEQFIIDGYNSGGQHRVLSVLDVADIETLVNITYSELKRKRQDGELLPGTLYRITDYRCTTSQENTSIGPGQFDIIVQAISESELSENGFATKHTGDKYFSECNVDSWEIKYTLDNNKDKFFWANNTIIDEYIISDRQQQGDQYNRYTDGDGRKYGTMYYAWGDSNHTVYTASPKPKVGDYIYYDDGIEISSQENVADYQFQEAGRGIIYWMKDEYGNECPYDFKHLKFLDSKLEEQAWTFNLTSRGTIYENLNDLSIASTIDAEIWVDKFVDSDNDGEWASFLEFTEQELAEDYTLNSGGYKIYSYTGNSITYNGTTLYIWRMSGRSQDPITSASLTDGDNYWAYLFTNRLDYSDVTVADHVEVYAFGSTEDTGDIYKLEKNSSEPYWIYHGTYSESAVPDLTSLIDDLSQVEAHLYLNNFVDENGNWTVDENVKGPEDLGNVTYSKELTFAGSCVEYEGKILFLWTDDNYGGTIFTTGLDYSSYNATDEIYPIYAIGDAEGAVAYQKDGRYYKGLNSIIIEASYDGPSIPAGNLYDPFDGEEGDIIKQNLLSSIQSNIIPSKYDNETGAQILDLTQIYYGPRKGYPYSKDEIDEAHKVIATALNEQKENLDKTIPFPEVIEVEHVSSSVIQELDPWKYYIFGEVSSLEVSFSEEVSEYTPIYRFLFTAAGSDTQLILPQNCSLASGHSLVMVEGKSYEITVINNIVRVISATLE